MNLKTTGPIRSFWAILKMVKPGLIAALLIFLPIVSEAQFTYTINNGAITITGYTGSGGAVTIPSTINGYPVTSIGEEAFYQCTWLTSVTIPNSVTSIGGGAFFGCYSLTSVTIGTNVTSIGIEAFYYCSSLSSVTIPNSVTSIGNGAFGYCNLTSVTIPNSVTNIEDYAFYQCTRLTNVTIPNSVTNIGNDMFDCCYSLTSVTIPNSVTSIGNEAFYYCSSLTSITIPNSVTRIGEEGFGMCLSLTNVMIGTNVTLIGVEQFCDCPSLRGVYFQGNTPAADSTAFMGDANVIIFYLSGTPGWGSTFDGFPTAIWSKPYATVALGNLSQMFNGTARNVTATTMPSGLTVNLTYNGSTSAPTNAGSYTVIGTINDLNYQGSTTNGLVVGLPPQSFTAINANSHQLSLQLTGTPNYPYTLQSTTNLTSPINWQPVITNSADINGNWSITVSNLSRTPSGFYRAVGQ